MATKGGDKSAGGGAKGLPPPEVMKTLLKNMQQQPHKDFQMTEKEGEMLEEAFQKPEFMALFQEYMDELSDPAHRKEHEAYIAQLERDNNVPADKKIIRPKAGFCVKTKNTKDKSKMFINVCYEDSIEQPTDERQPDGRARWSVPNSLGPPRMEKDNSGTPCTTFDIVFHPKALELAARSKAFKNMLVEIACDQVQQRLNKYSTVPMKLDSKRHILKHVQCIGGTPAIMTLGADPKPKKGVAAGAKAAAAAMAASAPSPAAAPAPAPPAKKAEQKKKAAQAAKKQQAAAAAKKPAATKQQAAAATTKKKKKAPLVEEVKEEVKAEEPLPAGVEKPEAVIVHRGEVDLGDFNLTRTKQTKQPKELVVKIMLPKLKSVRKVALDVSERMLELDAPGVYKLSLPLPYSVIDSQAAAKFVKDKRRLEVTLPVKPPVKQQPRKFVEPVEEEEDDAEAEAAAKAIAEANAAKRAAKKADHSRWVNPAPAPSPALVVPSPSAAAAAPASAPVPVPSSPPASPVKFLLPKYKFKQSNAAITLLMMVKNVQESSLVTKCTETSVSMQFVAGKDGSTKTCGFELETSAAIDPATFKVEVSSNNMVVMFSKAVPGKWASLGDICVPTAPIQAAASAPAAPAAVQDFIAASSFSGVKPGMVFKLDKQGLGYYRDALSAPEPAAAASAPATASGAGGAAGAVPAGSTAAKTAEKKSVPAPRRSAKVITHSGTSSSTPAAATAAAAAKPAKPHPLTGAADMGVPPRVSQPANAASKAAAKRVNDRDESHVQLQTSHMYDID